MEQLVASNLDELEKILEGFGDDVLYRGQNSHYGEPGQPSVLSSFDRQGCIPSEMVKWNRYCQKVLDAFLEVHRGDLAFQQALLQHYGWRSFYVDCTSSPAVAAWFASHRYQDRLTLEMSEDCYERAVWLRKRMASYSPVEADGHLYVLDKKSAVEVGLVDLATLTIEGFRPRTTAQSAWLIGPMRNTTVPQNCYIAQITAPSNVLRDFASSRGLADTNTLFPSVYEDPILKVLLGLPWDEIKTNDNGKNNAFDLPIFRRTLDLPEYQESYVKIAPASIAFYRRTKILDIRKSIDGDPYGATLVSVPDIVLYGSPDQNLPLRFPHIDELIDENSSVAFEVEALIKHPQQGGQQLYQKGIGVIRREPNLVEVCELLVSHPGLEMTHAGFNEGWFYRRQPDGLWVKEENPLQCSCGNELVHRQHILALHIVEDFLEDPDSYE